MNEAKIRRSARALLAVLGLGVFVRCGTTTESIEPISAAVATRVRDGNDGYVFVTRDRESGRILGFSHHASHREYGRDGMLSTTPVKWDSARHFGGTLQCDGEPVEAAAIELTLSHIELAQHRKGVVQRAGGFGISPRIRSNKNGKLVVELMRVPVLPRDHPGYHADSTGKQLTFLTQPELHLVERPSDRVLASLAND